jgi:hypothetical protein
MMATTYDYKDGALVPAADRMRQHEVSKRVAPAALAMPAANRDVACQAPTKTYCATRDRTGREGQVRG